MENIDERIKDVMAGVFGVDSELLNDDSSHDNVDGWDSIKHLDLIVSLEEEFDVTIPMEEVNNLVSYKYIKLMIQELLG